MPTKVLVFESDSTFAGELRNELGKLGCSITVVDDGNIGLQQASTERPDLILLSIELPRMNGFSVCNKLKKDGALRDVPLIIMSSESSDETFEQHKKLRTRAEDYVHKPMAFGELLEHIQRFVPIGIPSGGETEAAIVIDDEIEISNAEYVLDEEGAPIAQRRSSKAPRMEAVDADVDAFAEAAFGRLTDEPPTRGTQSNGTQPDSVTSQISARTSIAPAARSSVPPAAARAASRPPPGVDVAEHERVREELAKTRDDLTKVRSEVVKLRDEVTNARDHAAEIDRQLREARSETERLRLEEGESERLTREVEELKAKLAGSAAKGGISSRDFLDLREALNKKDKEILGLKEQLSKKDKEIVDGHDRQLSMERMKADAEDRLLVLERELSELRDKSEALAADKDLAKKLAEDVKVRLEKARGENEAKERLLAEANARQAEEVGKREALLTALRSELDQTMANERAEHARALDQVESRRKSDVENAEREQEAALAEQREQAQRERQEALSEQGMQLRVEHEARLTELRRAHDDANQSVRADAERVAREAAARFESTLAAARSQAEDELAAVRAQGEERERTSLDRQSAEHAQKLAAVAEDRDSRIGALEAKAARELGDAHERLTKLEADLTTTRSDLESTRRAKEASDAESAVRTAELDRRVNEASAARDELQRKLGAKNESMAGLETDLGAVRAELSELKQKLTAESSRAERAHAKWDADRQSLERAKDALAVALSQIEEAEGRSLS